MADTHGHGHPALGHHFETLEQQHEANILGMWLFLATEILLFGGLFAAYIIFQVLYPEIFMEASPHQNVVIGTTNTVVLIISSLTMALAVHSAEHGSGRTAALLLVATVLLGAIFMGFKGVEYYQHWEEGLVPGLRFTNEEFQNPRVELFFLLYFVMTGIHALHLLIGMAIVAIVAYRVARGSFLGVAYTPVELLGLYWHLIDVVWVFLFPMLYLIGRQAGAH